MDNQLMTREEAIKKLWKRPEGVFGTITGIGVLGGIFYLLYKALPFLVSMASNMIYLVLEIVALVVLLYVFLNKDTWRNFSLMWYQLNRKILSLVVDMDPISVLKKAIHEMRDNLDIIHDKVTELNSVTIAMEKKLKEYKTAFDDSTRKKKYLEEKLKDTSLSQSEIFANRNALTNVNNSLVRCGEQINRQQERLKTSKKYYEIMQKLEVYAGYKVQDAEDNLHFKEEEFAQAKATRSAMKSIMSIMKGGLSETVEQEMALSSINDTVNMSLSEMRRLIDGSNDILETFKMNSDINADKAEELLRMYDEHGFEIFSDGEEHNPEVNANMRKALSESSRKKEPVYVEAEIVEEVPSAKRYF